MSWEELAIPGRFNWCGLPLMEDQSQRLKWLPSSPSSYSYILVNKQRMLFFSKIAQKMCVTGEEKHVTETSKTQIAGLALEMPLIWQGLQKGRWPQDLVTKAHCMKSIRLQWENQSQDLTQSPADTSIKPLVTLLGTKSSARLLAYIAVSAHMGLLWIFILSFRLLHPHWHLRFHQFSIHKIYQQGYYLYCPGIS